MAEEERKLPPSELSEVSKPTGAEQAGAEDGPSAEFVDEPALAEAAVEAGVERLAGEELVVIVESSATSEVSAGVEAGAPISESVAETPESLMEMKSEEIIAAAAVIAQAVDLAQPVPPELGLSEGASEPMVSESVPVEPEAVSPFTAPPSAPPPPLIPEALPETSGDDKLLAALTWLTMVVFQLPILSIVLLLIEPNRTRSFQRYHAVTSIAFWCAAVIYEIVAGVTVGMLTLFTLGIFAFCMICLWVIFFVPHIIALVFAFQALTGKTPEIPVITKLARDQRWI